MALPVGSAAVTLALMVRGGRGVVRYVAGAGRRVRWGVCTGAANSVVVLLLIWIGPTDVLPKLVFSLFMLPMAAATWAAARVSRTLREDDVA